jgi:malate dehydrogenase
MPTEVAVVGGGGTIGATVAYTLAVSRPSLDVSLVDVDADRAAGHAKDVRHARCHAAHPVGAPSLGVGDGTGGGGRGTGAVRSASASPDALAGADCLVVTASAPRPEDSARRGGRAAFFERNRAVMDDVAEHLSGLDPRPTLVVTNPLDRTTRRLWESSGWPREAIMGYSLSETARLADWLADHAGVAPSAVSCPVLGEHGEHVVPAFSRATVGGEPVSLSPDERADALDFVRDAPYDVIRKRGEADSSRWVTGRGVAAVVERVVDDDPVTTCLSVPLAGEYGCDGLCLSVPVRLGGLGWREILDWELSDWERERFERAREAVSEPI